MCTLQSVSGFASSVNGFVTSAKTFWVFVFSNKSSCACQSAAEVILIGLSFVPSFKSCVFSSEVRVSMYVCKISKIARVDFSSPVKVGSVFCTYRFVALMFSLRSRHKEI